MKGAELSVLFRVASRREYHLLRDWHKACPDSRIEYLASDLYVLHVPVGRVGTRDVVA